MKEIAKVFFRIGTLGFGGPLATVALMEEETSRKRKWITPERFAELYAVCKLMPGPVATQVAISVGYLRGGFLGGIIAGLGFVLPSFVVVLILSYFYFQGGASQQSSWAFSAMQASALAVILLSTVQLARPYRKQARAWAVALLSAGLILWIPRWEPLVILGFGLVGISLARARGSASLRDAGSPVLAGLSASGIFAAFSDSVLPKLFWVCFKAGAFVFGTGLAVVPLLEADVVQHYAWLTHEQFMAGLAIGQITPGPVVITSTFIGYQVAGLVGAGIATAGMFLPPFVIALFILPHAWKRISGTPEAQGFSNWAIPAVIGGILGTTLRLGYATLTETAGDLPRLLPTAVFLASLAATWRYKLPAWLVIPACGVLTGLLQWLLGLT